MYKIIRFVLLDVLKSKVLLSYLLLLATITWGVFSLEDNSTKGVLTLLNIMLLTVPLVSIIFSTIYVYNSAEFIELLVSQPIKRTKIWTGLYLGINLALFIAFSIGMGIPIVYMQGFEIGLMVYSVGVLISCAFVSLALFSAVYTRDKTRGIGAAIMQWLFFTLLFDALVVLFLFQFSDYPIEELMVGITLLSPVDIARILVILQMDIAAMLGHTGAIFKAFFGTTWGLIIAYIVLCLWSFIPFVISLQKFRKKDL